MYASPTNLPKVRNRPIRFIVSLMCPQSGHTKSQLYTLHSQLCCGATPTCNFCKNLRKKSQLDFRQLNDILLLYEIELLENEQFTIEQYIAKQKPTEKQVISNV